MVRHYFDHASTSPLRPEAREAVVAALEVCGDPGRIYSEALEARVLVEQARGQVAQFLGATPRSVVFTSGATEAIAAVVHGSAARGHHHAASSIEHSAVLKSIGAEGDEDGRQPARNLGATLVGVDGSGRAEPGELLSAVTEETAVVHLQMANHEVGTLQDVEAAANLCRERGVWLHVDAAQAVGHLPVKFDELGADFMSVSAHKFGGPAGVGALLVRRGIRLEPLLAGGDQERARRAGLENVPAIAGLGAVCESLGCLATAAHSKSTIGSENEAKGDTSKLSEKAVAESGTSKLSKEAVEEGGTSKLSEKIVAKGDTSKLSSEAAEHYAMTERILETLGLLEGVEHIGHPTERAPHIVCFHIVDVEPQALVLELDRRGFAVHSGSSCSSESLEPSPVLAAMGYDGQRSLRISVGWSTTEADVDALLSAVPQVLSDLRSLRPG